MNYQSIINKTRSDYNTIASDFSQKRQFMWQELIPFFSYIKPGSKVLDIGCGNARAYKLLQNKNIYYHGVDYSENLIKLAQKKYPNVKFTIADINDNDTWLNLKEYDVVLCLAVLHHFPTPVVQMRLLNHIFRSLKKNGILIISVWNLYQPKYWHFHLQQLLYKLLNWQFQWVKVPYIVQKSDHKIIIHRFCYAFTKNELPNLLLKTGFTIVESKYGRNLCFVAKKVV